MLQAEAGGYSERQEGRQAQLQAPLLDDAQVRQRVCVLYMYVEGMSVWQPLACVGVWRERVCVCMLAIFGHVFRFGSKTIRMIFMRGLRRVCQHVRAQCGREQMMQTLLHFSRAHVLTRREHALGN